MKKRLARVALCLALVIVGFPAPSALADHPNLGTRVYMAAPYGPPAGLDWGWGPGQVVFLSGVIGTADARSCGPDYISPPGPWPIQTVVAIGAQGGGAVRTDVIVTSPCCSGFERGTVLVHVEPAGVPDCYIGNQDYLLFTGYVLNQR